MRQINYKIQVFNTVSGFWDTLFSFSENEYDQAYRALYNKYKLDNTKQYRLLMVTEDILDSLFPPGS